MKYLIIILGFILIACEQQVSEKVINGYEIPEGYQLIQVKATCYSSGAICIIHDQEGYNRYKLNTFDDKWYFEYSIVNNTDSLFTLSVIDPKLHGDSIYISIDGKQIVADSWVYYYNY